VSSGAEEVLLKVTTGELMLVERSLDYVLLDVAAQLGCG